MSSGMMFRRAVCVTLRNKRNRSASCYARITSNALNSRSIVCVESQCYNFNRLHYYSTETKRHWKHMNDAAHPSDPSFTLMSYNILAQHLINTQPSLYIKHNPNALHWTHRFNAMKREIGDISPDILCLQEVQQTHLTEIASHFDDLGYDTTLFKKRTGLHIDGCAIFFKKQLFDLIEFNFVDYFQPNIKILNRCNVAIIAKLALKSKPTTNFVVSTTHLLFNPKRHEIRLAQLQVLLAELDRIARNETQPNQTVPIILTGDFNLQQNSDEFQLIIGKPVAPTDLLPCEIGISDHCQHLNVAVNSNRYQTALHASEHANGKAVQKRTLTSEEIINSKLPFNTGYIQHKLNLLPTFSPQKPFQMDLTHASTFHNKWLMVDYIFFSDANSTQSESIASKLRLLEIYQLPTILECFKAGPIPNERLGSDHYSTAARFSIK